MTRTLAPATFGMAGMIYTGETGQSLDESWIRESFPATPLTTSCEWNSSAVTIVTCQHASEAQTEPGTSNGQVPAVGDYQGAVFGHFFGADAAADRSGLSARILEQFAARGSKAFEDLNGAWVAVIWNARQREAYFVRDRLGVYTLYAGQLRDRIVFSTDLRVLQANDILAGVDDQAYAEFLHYLYVPTPRTTLQRCHGVLPGHLLTLRAADNTANREPSNVRQQRYAPPRFVRGRSLQDEASIAREIEGCLPEFEDRLLQAVADCIPARGRVALMLSGGKDSSTLAVALSKICRDRVLAVNIGAKDQRFDEAADAALVCRALGLAYETYTPTDDDLARGIYQFAAIQDQPIGDIAALPYFLGISRLPDDCTIVFDGTGNDYYFGYPSTSKGGVAYRRRAQFGRYIPQPAWHALVGLMKRGPGPYRALSHYWERPIEETFVAWEGWSLPELEALLNRKVSFAGTYLWEVMRRGRPDQWLPLITEVVCSIWEPHAAFRKGIYSVHALGRGIRYPFIDDRLASFVNGLPEELKYRGGVNKTIVRAYMKKNLPREIVEKPKGPFVFDLNRLFLNPLHRWADRLQADGRLKVLPTWSDKPIAELLSRHRNAPDDARWQHRLYALCQLATVHAMKEGYDPKLSV